MKNKIQKQRIDVMLDMETCDTAETAAILEIALVPFHLDGTATGEREENIHINLTSCFMEGMTTDQDTQKWWMKQSDEAKEMQIFCSSVTIRAASAYLYESLENLSSKYDLHLWSRGLNFDIPKLDRCFRTVAQEKELPYPWWNLEDVRTYCRAFDVHTADMPFEGTAHSAYHDCKHQIRLVQKAYAIRKAIQEKLNVSDFKELI